MNLITLYLKKDFADCYDIENRAFHAKQGCLSIGISWNFEWVM